MTRKGVAVFGLVLSLCLTTVDCEGTTSGVSPGPRLTTGLRGVVLRELSCSSKPKPPNDRVVAIIGVREFLLCRTGLRGVARSPLTVRAAEPMFKRLMTALSVSNAPPTTACPVLSEAEIVLLARTDSDAFRVSIPVDGCGLYQKSAVEAIYGPSTKPAS